MRPRKEFQIRQRRIVLASSLKSYILESGKSQRDIAQASGIAEMRISQIVNARRDTTKDELRKIAEGLGITVAVIDERASSLSKDKRFMAQVNALLKRNSAAQKSLDAVGRSA